MFCECSTIFNLPQTNLSLLRLHGKCVTERGEVCRKPGGGRIRYEPAFARNGVKFIFVMGLSIDAFGWSNEFLSQFISNGFGVIRFDNRCTGGSSSIINYGKTKFTLSDMAADALAVLDAEHIDEVHAVGISLGGMIVQQMALDFPSRVRSITSMMSGAQIHPFNLSIKSYPTF